MVFKHTFSYFLKENISFKRMTILENLAVISRDYVQVVDSLESFDLNSMYLFTLVIEFNIIISEVSQQKFWWYPQNMLSFKRIILFLQNNNIDWKNSITSKGSFTSGKRVQSDYNFHSTVK